MRRTYRVVLAGVALLAAMAGIPATVSATEEPNCLTRVSIVGFPHRLKMVAELNAVSAWSIQSEKQGLDYGMWHNARGNHVSCTLMTKSLYYRCTATARPCLAGQVHAKH